MQSIRKYQVCDRCKVDIAEKRGNEFDGWGKLVVTQVNGPLHFGEKAKPLDICERCLDDFRQWYEAGVK